MTVEKVQHFQKDLRTLFEKYRIESGFAFFIHDEALHPIEVHVARRNELITLTMDALTEVLKQIYPELPFEEVITK